MSHLITSIMMAVGRADTAAAAAAIQVTYLFIVPQPPCCRSDYRLTGILVAMHYAACEAPSDNNDVYLPRQ